MIKPILQLGNSILRKKSQPIKDAETLNLTLLIGDLRDTLDHAKKKYGYGRGIAAPQIGRLKRAVFVNMPDFKGPLINPEITWASADTFEVWDSCFSFNVEFFVLVDRHLSIRVDYLDQKFKKHEIEAKGALSELLQHEIDHLDGVLAVDRMKSSKDMMMRSEYEKRQT